METEKEICYCTNFNQTPHKKKTLALFPQTTRVEWSGERTKLNYGFDGMKKKATQYDVILRSG